MTYIGGSGQGHINQPTSGSYTLKPLKFKGDTSLEATPQKPPPQLRPIYTPITPSAPGRRLGTLPDPFTNYGSDGAFLVPSAKIPANMKQLIIKEIAKQNDVLGNPKYGALRLSEGMEGKITRYINNDGRNSQVFNDAIDLVDDHGRESYDLLPEASKRFSGQDLLDPKLSHAERSLKEAGPVSRVLSLLTQHPHMKLEPAKFDAWKADMERLGGLEERARFAAQGALDKFYNGNYLSELSRIDLNFVRSQSTDHYFTRIQNYIKNFKSKAGRLISNLDVKHIDYFKTHSALNAIFLPSTREQLFVAAAEGVGCFSYIDSKNQFFCHSLALAYHAKNLAFFSEQFRFFGSSPDIIQTSLTSSPDFIGTAYHLARYSNGLARYADQWGASLKRFL